MLGKNSETAQLVELINTQRTWNQQINEGIISTTAMSARAPASLKDNLINIPSEILTLGDCRMNPK